MSQNKTLLVGQGLVFREINCTRKVFRVETEVYKIFQLIQLTMGAIYSPRRRVIYAEWKTLRSDFKQIRNFMGINSIESSLRICNLHFDMVAIDIEFRCRCLEISYSLSDLYHCI